MLALKFPRYLRGPMLFADSGPAQTSATASAIISPALVIGSYGKRPKRNRYYGDKDHSWLATVLNVVLRLVPTRLNAEMAATAINAAIRAYSIAVTPD